MRNRRLNNILKILNKTISIIFDLISKLHYLIRKIKNERNKNLKTLQKGTPQN